MQIRLRILEYMEKSKISVDDVAKELHIDKKSFIKIVRRTGVQRIY